jgi:O-antigen/teichoic acid export membrane protein
LNVKNVLGFAFGPLALAMLGVVNVPLLAWLFSPEDIGRLNILQMLCAFSIMVFSLGLDQAYIREYHARSNKSLLFFQCFFPVVCIFLITSLAAVLISSTLIGGLFRTDSRVIESSVWVAMASTLILRFLTSVLRMQNRGWLFSFCQISNRVLLIIMCLLTYVFWRGGDFTLLSILFAVSIASATLLAAWFVRGELSVAFSQKVTFTGFGSLMQFGAPLVASGFFYWGLTAAGTFALSHYSSLSELGIYSVALSLGGAATIFQQIFTVMWAPTVYKWVEAGVDRTRFESVMTEILSWFALLFCLVGTFCWVVDWFLPESYSEVKFYVLCAIVPPLLYTLSEISSVGIGIARKTWLNILVTGLALVVSLLLNYILVPKFGAAGALVSAVVAHVIFLLIKTEFAYWAWQSMARIRLYCTVLLFSAASIITLYFGVSGSGYVSLFWAAALSVVLWRNWESYRTQLIKILPRRS